MKCIQMCGPNGKITKLNDADAIDLVFKNKAKFISKEVYKQSAGKGPDVTAPKPNSKNQNKKSIETSKNELNNV